MMEHSLSYSNGLFDSDGECYDNGVFLHIGKSTIIRFSSVDELEKFGKQVLNIVDEINS